MFILLIYLVYIYHLVNYMIELQYQKLHSDIISLTLLL
jgi:hypothetical protein